MYIVNSRTFYTMHGLKHHIDLIILNTVTTCLVFKLYVKNTCTFTDCYKRSRKMKSAYPLSSMLRSPIYLMCSCFFFNDFDFLLAKRIFFLASKILKSSKRQENVYFGLHATLIKMPNNFVFLHTFREESKSDR